MARSLVSEMERTQKLVRRGVVKHKLVCSLCGGDCELRNALLVCTSESCGRVHQRLSELDVGERIR